MDAIYGRARFYDLDLDGKATVGRQRQTIQRSKLSATKQAQSIKLAATTVGHCLLDLDFANVYMA